MSGVEAVCAGDLLPTYEFSALLMGSASPEDINSIKRTKQKLLLESAKRYLEEARIDFPFSELEVEDDVVVMHGVPNCGELLVCALKDSTIQNCL